MVPGKAGALALQAPLLRRMGEASLKEGACFDLEPGLPFGFL